MCFIAQNGDTFKIPVDRDIFSKDVKSKKLVNYIMTFHE